METDQLDDEDLAFSAAFNSTTEPEPKEPEKAAASETPAPAEAAAEPEAKKDEPKQEEQVVEDPYAGFNPKVRDLLATIPTLQQQLALAEKRANDALATAGRVSALQSEIEKLKQGIAAPAPRPELEKVKALRAQGLDEIADAFQEVIEHTAPPAKAEAPAAQPPAAAPAEAPPASDPQMEVLKELRPTWAEDVESTDFRLWFATQPPQRQQELASTGKAVVLLKALGEFDAYKQALQSTRQLDATRQSRIAAAVTPQGDGRPSQRAPSPEDEEEAAFRAAFRS